MSEQNLDPREELRQLTAQIRTRLAWSARWGTVGVPAGSSPRSLPTAATTAKPPESSINATASEAPLANAIPTDEPLALDAGGEGACVGEAKERGLHALARVRQDIGDCTRCGLCESRNKLVFGVGNPDADLVFVGEAPGAEEDLNGEPFVGAAGQLLTKMIEAMGFDRSSVYICNVIKCRPPGNRNPLPEEVATCEPFLKQQLAALQPRMIVALGKFAAQCLLQTDTPITRLRGQWGTYEGIEAMPTFHPAYLLRNPDGKRLVWQDLKAVLAALSRMGILPPHPPRT